MKKLDLRYNLKCILKDREMSQVELAEKLGISPTNLNTRLARGKKCQIDLLDNISNIFPFIPDVERSRLCCKQNSRNIVHFIFSMVTFGFPPCTKHTDNVMGTSFNFIQCKLLCRLEFQKTTAYIYSIRIHYAYFYRVYFLNSLYLLDCL